MFRRFSLKPHSFRERWHIATLAVVAGAGFVATAAFAAIILIIWKGGWSPAVEALRINSLATAALCMAGLMAAAMVGILIAGPLGRAKGQIGPVSFEAEGDAE